MSQLRTTVKDASNSLGTARIRVARILRLISWGVLGSLFSLGLVGIAYQTFSMAHESRGFPAPGKLIDVGGRRMHIFCSGSGAPTVILESGLTRSSLDWFFVQPEVAHFTRVCSYDRAGYGWSDYTSGPRTLSDLTNDLQILLERSGEKPPYLLVGQSLGGIIVRSFALEHRDEVAGIVLVDSSHEDQMNRFPPRYRSLKSSKEFFQKRIIGLYFGIPRLTGSCGQDSLTPELAEETVFLECRPTPWRTALREIEILGSRQIVPARGAFGNMPLEVLTRDVSLDEREEQRNADPVWLQLQQELRDMSQVGTQSKVPGASHSIHIDKPQAVVTTIRRVWESSKGAPACEGIL